MLFARRRDNFIRRVDQNPHGWAWVTRSLLQVPGDYLLVDHALSRAARGLIGTLHVEGEANPQVFAAPEDTAMGEMKSH
jgi:nitrite reductase (NO-forming)